MPVNAVSVSVNAGLYSVSYTFDASVRGTQDSILSGSVEGALIDDGDTILTNKTLSASIGELGYPIESRIGLRAEVAATNSAIA